jgi:Ca2+-transporting ATPase
MPFLQTTFGTYGLPLIDWVIVAGLAMTVSPILELAKWMERKGWLGEIV